MRRIRNMQIITHHIDNFFAHPVLANLCSLNRGGYRFFFQGGGQNSIYAKKNLCLGEFAFSGPPLKEILWGPILKIIKLASGPSLRALGAGGGMAIPPPLESTPES